MLVERKSNGSEIDEMNFFIDDTINSDEANNNTSLLDNPNFDSGGFYLTLGSIDFNNMARPFNGSISELMIFNRGLTDLEKSVLLRHISEKWDLDSVVDSDMDGTKDDMEGDEVEWAFIEVKDQAGNLVDLTSAPQSTSDGSKVQIDASHPEILEVSITSSNANSNLAKEGDNLTLTFKVSEPIRGPTSTEVTIDQVGSLDFEKIDSLGMEWQAKTSISSGLTDNASISLQVYDAAGNPSDLVVQTTDSSYVTFDTTIPTITIDSLTSDNAKTFLAKSGDQLTLNFTSSETILTPQIIIAGASADAVNASGDGLNWEVNTKVLDNTSNGLVDFEISFKDPAGNSGNKLCSAPTSYCGTSLNVDTSTPILELVRIQSNNDNTTLARTGETVTLNFTSSEVLEGPSVRINGVETVLTGNGKSWEATYLVPNFRAKIITLAGTPGVKGFHDGDGSSAKFDNPASIEVDDINNVFVADIFNNRIRKIDSSGIVTTYSGSGIAGLKDGPGTTATFNLPHGVGVDSSGIVYVADWVNHSIRQIDTDGNVNTYAGIGTEGSLNGQRDIASFKNPHNLTIDASGNIYIADCYNHLVRKIDLSGNVTTVAGTAGVSGAINANGTSASFNCPSDLEIDAFGNIYVSDHFNNLIRKIDVSKEVTTFAGSGEGGSNDGVGTQAQFNGPLGLALDSLGNLIVADYHTNLIRTIDPLGTVKTLIGTGDEGSDDGDENSATMSGPHDVATDKFDNVYLATRKDHLVRKINLVRDEINFRIDFADAAGNSGSVDNTTDNSLVKVDLEAPVILNDFITSTNQEPNWGRYGDNITLSFSTSEPIQDPTDNISVDGLTGIVVVGNDDKTEWTATGQVASNAAGMANYSISVKDHAGNVATPVTSTTSINLDTESPSLNNVVLTTSNTNTSFAKSGDNLTLTFNASELIEIPLVTLAGTNVDVQDTNSGAGTSWQATYTVQDGDNGTVAFSIQYQDQAGNSGAIVTSPDLNNSITMDTEDPILSQVKISLITDNISLAKEGDVVYLHFNSTEELINPIVTIMGEEKILDDQGTDWITSYLVRTNDEFNPYVSTPFDQGRVVYFPFSGNANDISLNENNGVVSGAILTTDRFGYMDRAYQFDGDNDYIQISSPNNLNFEETNQITISSWFKLENNQNYDGLVSINGVNFRIMIDPSKKIFYDAGSHNDVQVNYQIAENKWYHYVMTVEGGDKAYIYINGENIYEDIKGVPNTLPRGNKILIGSGEGSNIHLSNAIIDDVSIFNRKLSSTEIKELYEYESKASPSDKLLTFQIEYQDLAGNSGLLVHNTSDGSVIGIDTTQPKITDITIYSNNSDNQTAKSGENVFLTFTTSESVLDPFNN